MPRKQIIARRSVNHPALYYTNETRFPFSESIGDAHFYDEIEIDRAVTKLSQYYPGHIWEIKTVYHV